MPFFQRGSQFPTAPPTNGQNGLRCTVRNALSLAGEESPATADSHASRARRRDGALLAAGGESAVSAPIAASSLSELGHARQVNLQYLSKMPNFVADETARRYESGSAEKPWRLYDIVEDEIKSDPKAVTFCPVDI
jgi:hypothetical protein